MPRTTETDRIIAALTEIGWKLHDMDVKFGRRLFALDPELRKVVTGQRPRKLLVRSGHGELKYAR